MRAGGPHHRVRACRAAIRKDALSRLDRCGTSYRRDHESTGPLPPVCLL